MNQLRPTALASLLFLLAGCNSTPTHPTTPPAPDVQQDLRATISYLASDSLQGRGITTPGIDAAATYIKNNFIAAGLHAVPGARSFYQDFDHTTVTGIGPATTLSSGPKTFALARDYTVLSSSAQGAFTAPLVFAGYGISSEQDRYDDFANIDVKGKVCLILRFEPQTPTGDSRFAKDGYSQNAHLRNKFTACAAHGAAAVLLVNPPIHKPAADVLLPFASAFQEGPSPIPVLQITQTAAAQLLSQANAPSLADLQKSIDTTGKPNSQPLPDITLSGDVAITRTTKTLHNVCAYLPGSGPLAKEYVVIGAHYDHLGFGGPGSLSPGAPAIHHGADDNASGTAAIIELARTLSHPPSPHHPLPPSPSHRSLLFVAFTAEESGLIGSSQFVQHPPVPLDSIAAMLNLDMVGRVKNDTLYIGGAGTASPFDHFVKDADAHSPLQFKDFGRGGFGPSDHMSFASKKIPVLFLFSGMHADYHRPTDTADKINYDALAQVLSVARELTADLSTMPRSPYLASADARTPHMSGMTTTGSRPSLGVIPDYGTDITTGGVRITGTSPNTPAATAGLQDGDVIVGFNARKIDNLYDLTDALSAAKPGDQITLTYLRAGKPSTALITLAERPTQ